MLRSTGALSGVGSDPCGDIQYAPFVTCVEGGITTADVNVTATGAGTGKLVETPLVLRAPLSISSITINDPNGHIKDDIQSLLNFNLDRLKVLDIKAKGVSGTLDGVQDPSKVETLVIHGSLTGVFSLQSGKLKTVDLYNNNIDTFNAETFTQLESLNISSNKLATFSGFEDNAEPSALQSLDLSYNELTALPSQMQLPHVEHFDVSYNKIQGTLPSGVFNEDLKIFDASHNQFSGNVPTQVAQMSRMEHLDLSGNTELGGTLSVNANVFANVEVLDVGRTAIDLTIPASFLVNSKLRHFSVANAGTFTITGVPADAQLPNVLSDTLETLDLTGAGLTGPLPPEWADKPNLKEVNLVGNTITGCAPDVWTKHSALNAAYQGLKRTSDVRLCGGADAKETEKSGSNTKLIYGLTISGRDFVGRFTCWPDCLAVL
ncbi:hypothetical protein, conserved [Angomonas deanei]|uniref:Uncharacterized protein n=1 Tax=Angomonas deanei TaxID=59799 RepID=A0A7G2C908_9TRYP|nr:hypothetical protein, conserved [Angomonas deanei]